MNLVRFTPFLLAAVLPWPALAETAINESRPLAADARVEISNMRGRISVRGGEAETIEIRGTLGEGAKRLIVEGDRQRLRVKVDYPQSDGGWGGWWGRDSLGDSVLEVTLPRGVELEVSSVSADISVTAVDGKRMKAESVSGNVRIDGAPGELEVDAVSGDLELQIAGSKRVDIETVSGDATLQGRIDGRLKAQAVSGDLSLRLSGAPLADANISAVSGDVELEASLAKGGRFSVNNLSGDVELRLPADTSARLRIETFSGNIRSDVGKVEKEEYGPGARLAETLGAGDGEIRLESFSGNVVFRQR